MSDTPKVPTGEKVRYSRYKPQMYYPRMSIFWWVKQKPYVRFIVRELTSIFVALYAILMIIQINALRQGPESWEAFTDWLATPFSVGLHIVILAFVIYHSLTWFWVAPTAMVLHIGGKKVPAAAIIAGNIAMWLIISLVFGWLFVTI